MGALYEGWEFGPARSRFDGVVAYDVLFDLGTMARRHMPTAANWLRDHGFSAVVDLIIRAKSGYRLGSHGMNNVMWALGTTHPLDTVTELQKFTLSGVAERITPTCSFSPGQRISSCPPSR